MLSVARALSPTVHGGRVTPDARAPATPRPRPKVVGAGGDPLPGWVWSTVQTDAHAVWRGSPPLHGAVPQPGTQDLVDGEAGRPPRRGGVPVGRPSPDGASYRELPSAGRFLDKIEVLGPRTDGTSLFPLRHVPVALIDPRCSASRIPRDVSRDALVTSSHLQKRGPGSRGGAGADPAETS